MNFKTTGSSLYLLNLSLLLLLWMAIYNGSPLVYSDSASYLWAGITLSVPIDRPILYSMLIRWFTLGVSLWIMLAFQCSIGLYLIWLTVRQFITNINTSFITFVLTVYLVIFTTIAYYAGQLMPDFLCSLSLLCLALIITGYNLRMHTWSMIFIFILISGTHLSNLLSLFIAFIILVTIQFLGSFFGKKSYYKKNQLFSAFLLIVVSWLFVSGMNYKYSGIFKPSSASHIFMMARLNESGVLKSYLEDNCEKDPSILCLRKNTLPKYTWEFVWTDTILASGPCMEKGWPNCWLEKKKEFDPIIFAVFTTPKYLMPHLNYIFNDFKKQVFDIENATLNPLQGAAEDAINRKYPADIDAYRSSLQYKEQFHPGNLDSLSVPFSNACSILVFIWVIVITIINYFFPLKIKINRKLFQFSLFISLTYLTNAWVCVFFSNELNRYQGRISWLMPFLLFIWIGNLLLHKEEKDQIP